MLREKVTEPRPPGYGLMAPHTASPEVGATREDPVPEPSERKREPQRKAWCMRRSIRCPGQGGAVGVRRRVMPCAAGPQGPDPGPQGRWLSGVALESRPSPARNKALNTGLRMCSLLRIKTQLFFFSD